MAAIPLDLLDRIRALEQQVRALAGRAQMRPALDKILHGDIVIGEGGQLIAQTPNGTTAFSVGQTVQGDWGITLRRENGTRAISIGDDILENDQMLRMWSRDKDAPDRVLMMDDAFSDRFLGRPVLPLQLHPTSRHYDNAPTDYQLAWWGAGPATHAVVEIGLYNWTAAGGQFKVTMQPAGMPEVTVGEFDGKAGAWTTKNIVQPLHGVEYMQWVTWSVLHRSAEAGRFVETRIYSAIQRHTYTPEEAPSAPKRTPPAAPPTDTPTTPTAPAPAPAPEPGLHRVND
ncbi:hypothetical protein [Streptomyces sp. NPDC053048]|uniref:hypothetical protein n=1 Tax=Streptomyces sp. NPDC053048 TaxID=3365694 RepID=UPI0037D57BCA